MSSLKRYGGLPRLPAEPRQSPKLSKPRGLRREPREEYRSLGGKDRGSVEERTELQVHYAPRRATAKGDRQFRPAFLEPALAVWPIIRPRHGFLPCAILLVPFAGRPMQPVPKIPGYELLASLGGGPMTCVYSARDCEADVPCA